MSADLAESVLAAVRVTLRDARLPVPLHAPEFRGREWSYLKDCLDTGWVSSVGAYVDRIERDLEAFTGIGHAVAVSNGTAALDVWFRLAVNNWLNAVILDRPVRQVRDQLLKALNDAGHQARSLWTLMHRLPMYADCPRDDLAVAEGLEDRVVNLPSSGTSANL